MLTKAEECQQLAKSIRVLIDMLPSPAAQERCREEVREAVRAGDSETLRKILGRFAEESDEEDPASVPVGLRDGRKGNSGGGRVVPVLASADTQSGKTKFIICGCIRSIVHGRIPVVVLRNFNGDLLQFKNRFEVIAKDLADYTEQKAGERVLLETALPGGGQRRPGPVICLANAPQLKRLNLEDYTYDLFIDEMDHVDYGKKKGVLCGVAAVLAGLKEKAHQVIGVTATPLDVVFTETDLKAGSQIRLTPPDDFRGPRDFEVSILQESVHGLSRKVKSFEEILALDKNLGKFLDDIVARPLEYSQRISGRNPNMVLIKNSRLVRSQTIMAGGIQRKYPGQVVTIVYNGNGVTMDHSSLPATFRIGDVRCWRGKAASVDISSALQYLKDNGGCRVYPCIIILAGDLAGRSISYVSRDYGWHLSDMYYVPAQSSGIPELVQSAGRLCGRNKGGVTLRLHCTQEVADALYKGYHFTNEVMIRAISDLLVSGEVEHRSFREIVRKVPISRLKVPGRTLGNKARITPTDFNLVRVGRDDGGESLESYEEWKGPTTP